MPSSSRYAALYVNNDTIVLIDNLFPPSAGVTFLKKSHQKTCSDILIKKLMPLISWFHLSARLKFNLKRKQSREDKNALTDNKAGETTSISRWVSKFKYNEQFYLWENFGYRS